MPLLKQKTPSDGDGCEWRLSKLAFLLLTAITAILQIQPFWCEKQFLALSGRKETSREKRNAKYGFCWRSEILVLKKASKLNKLSALSRWHLLGYFLSFFSTVFLFFFYGHLKFLRADGVGNMRSLERTSTPGLLWKRGRREENNSLSMWKESGRSERAWGGVHSTRPQRPSQDGLGCQRRGYTLTHRSLLSNADRTMYHVRVFIIYWSKRWLAILRFHTGAGPESVKIQKCSSLQALTNRWIIRFNKLEHSEVCESIMQTLRTSFCTSTSHVCAFHEMV